MTVSTVGSGTHVIGEEVLFDYQEKVSPNTNVNLPLSHVFGVRQTRDVTRAFIDRDPCQNIFPQWSRCPCGPASVHSVVQVVTKSVYRRAHDSISKDRLRSLTQTQHGRHEQ